MNVMSEYLVILGTQTRLCAKHQFVLDVSDFVFSLAQMNCAVIQHSLETEMFTVLLSDHHHAAKKIEKWIRIRMEKPGIIISSEH